MANEFDLSKNNIDNKTIDNYIITKNPEILKNHDNSGNIIIYLSDGEDLDNNIDEYRDLYIGDEHIAGGFGFKDATTRNSAEHIVKYYDNEKQNIENKINDLEKSIQNSKIEYDVNLTIDSVGNTIQTNSGIYELDFNKEESKLSFKNDIKPSVYNVEIEFNNGTKFDDKSKTYVHDITKPLTISKISFIYEGTKLPSSFYLSYKSEHNTYDFGFVGDYNDSIYFSDNINKDKHGILKKISNVYRLTDPNKNPNMIQQMIELELNSDPTNPQYNILKNEVNEITENIELGIYEIKLSIIDESGRKVTLTIAKIKLVQPLFYNASESLIDFNLNPHETLLIGNENEYYDITFNHGISSFSTVKSTSEWVYVPEQYSNEPEMWYDEDIFLRTMWENYSSCIINNINYRIYKSPNDYSGALHWKIKLHSER